MPGQSSRHSRRITLLCGAAALLGLLLAAPAASAAPASAVDQYTEQPPGNAGGPLVGGDSERGQGNGGAPGAPGGGGGGGSPGGGANGLQGPTGNATGGGSATSAGGKGAGSHANGTGDTVKLASDEGGSEGGALLGYPFTSLLWIVLALIALSLAVRLGIAARNRRQRASTAG